MKTPFFPKTMGEWAYLVDLIGGAMWAWTTFYLTKTYASPVYVDTQIVKEQTRVDAEIDRQGSAMTAQHVDMMERFSKAIEPLKDLPSHVAQLDTYVSEHRAFTDEEKRTLKELNEKITVVRPNQAVVIASLATFREDEKMIIDRLNRLIGRQKPEGLSSNQ